MPFDPTFVGLAIFLIPVGLSRLHPALVCVCVCARSPVQGAGGCDSQPLETLFGDFIDACLQHSGVLGTLQLCHIRTSWQHLFLSLWRGTELPPCCHKSFATLLPAVFAGSQGLQGLPTLLLWQSFVSLVLQFSFDTGPVSSPSLSRPCTSEHVMPELCSEAFF